MVVFAETWAKIRFWLDFFIHTFRVHDMICQQVRQWIIQIGIGYHATISIVFDSYFHTGEKMFKSDFQLFFF